MSRPCSAPSPGKHAPRCRSSRKGLEPGLPRAAHARPVSAPLPCVGRRPASSNGRPGSAPFRATHQRPASAAAELGRRKQIHVGMSRVPLPLTFDEMYQEAKDRVARKRLDFLLENQEMDCFSSWHLRGSQGQSASRTDEEDPLMQKEFYRSRDAHFKMSKEDRQWVKSSLQLLGEKRYAYKLGPHTLTDSAIGTSAAIHAPPSSEADEELQGEREGDRGSSTTEKRTDLGVSEDNVDGHRQQEALASVLPEKKTRRYVAVMQYGVSSGMLQDPAKVMFDYQRAREECEARRKKQQEKSEMRVVQSQEIPEAEKEPSHQSSNELSEELAAEAHSRESYRSSLNELSEELAAAAHSRKLSMRSEKKDAPEVEKENNDGLENEKDTQSSFGSEEDIQMYQSQASVGTFVGYSRKSIASSGTCFGSSRKSVASSGTFVAYSRKSVASSGSLLYQSEAAQRRPRGESDESEAASLLHYKSTASPGARDSGPLYPSHQSEAASLVPYKSTRSAASSGNQSEATDYPSQQSEAGNLSGSLLHYKSGSVLHHKSAASPGARDSGTLYPSHQSEANSLVRYKSSTSSPLYPSYQSEAKVIVECRRAREEWEARRQNLHVHFDTRPQSPPHVVKPSQEPLLPAEEEDDAVEDEDDSREDSEDAPVYTSEASVASFASFMRYSRKSVASEVGGLARDPRRSVASSGSLLYQLEGSGPPLYLPYQSESRTSVVQYPAYQSSGSEDTEGLQPRFQSVSLRTLEDVEEDPNEDLNCSMKSLKSSIAR